MFEELSIKYNGYLVLYFVWYTIQYGYLQRRVRYRYRDPAGQVWVFCSGKGRRTLLDGGSIEAVTAVNLREVIVLFTWNNDDWNKLHHI